MHVVARPGNFLKVFRSKYSQPHVSLALVEFHLLGLRLFDL